MFRAGSSAAKKVSSKRRSNRDRQHSQDRQNEEYRQDGSLSFHPVHPVNPVYAFFESIAFGV